MPAYPESRTIDAQILSSKICEMQKLFGQTKVGSCVIQAKGSVLSVTGLPRSGRSDHERQSGALSHKITGICLIQCSIF